VPLPIFDRNQGQIATAQAKVMGAKDAVADQEIAIRARGRVRALGLSIAADALLKVCPKTIVRPYQTGLPRARIDSVAPTSCASWMRRGWISRLKCCSFNLIDYHKTS